ncbi:MAG: hypothetical protein JSV88_10435 [Candidatus Aminicenantes bacterium]|nr:MAG: hypothetical protein JSV88_10435 [Candidatus Aminicenantes bacterium]
MKLFKRIFIWVLVVTVARLSLFPLDLKASVNFNASYSSEFKDLYGDNTRGFDLAIYPLTIGKKFKPGLQYSNFSASGELPVTGNSTEFSYNRLGVVLHFLFLQGRRFSLFAEVSGGLGQVKEKNYLGDDSKNAFYASGGAGGDYTFLKSGNLSLSSGVGLYYNASKVRMVSKPTNKNLNYFTLNWFIRVSLDGKSGN